ncbi:hypothetical protein [Lactobacillus sp. HT06-2]|uniref:hypothetical protein n=1 Tax=Lactobacillus sp. HT06-2 TaxID=2080222 RepID=UPI000CD80685|nr:hypothetical protein [Lactobacillus sp. HT06-2]
MYKDQDLMHAVLSNGEHYTGIRRKSFFDQDGIPLNHERDFIKFLASRDKKLRKSIVRENESCEGHKRNY